MTRVLWGCIAAVAVLSGGAWSGGPELRGVWAGEQSADALKVNSVWQGTCTQSDPKSSYPMVLFVKKRNGETFEGMTWYPTLGNGLVAVTGQVDAKGAVTFKEKKVLYGESYGDDQRVVSGITYNAKLDKTRLTGSAKVTEYDGPRSGKTIKLKEPVTVEFSLKLAE